MTVIHDLHDSKNAIVSELSQLLLYQAKWVVCPVKNGVVNFVPVCSLSYAPFGQLRPLSD